MGCKNAKIEGTAPIYDENCFMHVNVDADFFIFKPDVDEILDGIVIKKAADHIGALVHNAFNISIPKTDKNWLGKNIQLGQEIRMKILYTNFEGRLPYIKAEIQ